MDCRVWVSTCGVHTQARIAFPIGTHNPDLCGAMGAIVSCNNDVWINQLARVKLPVNITTLHMFKSFFYFSVM